MNRDASQKNWRTVEKYLSTLHFYGSETHLVFEMIVAGLKIHPVKPWTFWRPPLQIADLELEFRPSVSSHLSCFIDLQLRNADGHLGFGQTSFDVYPAFESALTPALEMQVEVIDELLRHFEAAQHRA